MTEQTQSPQDDEERGSSPDSGDVTQGSAQQPTVQPEADDPDLEGEERFDAG